MKGKERESRRQNKRGNDDLNWRSVSQRETQIMQCSCAKKKDDQRDNRFTLQENTKNEEPRRGK